jgi:hypothetical protein
MAGQEGLFAIALGVEEPIYIEKIEFDRLQNEVRQIKIAHKRIFV